MKKIFAVATLFLALFMPRTSAAGGMNPYEVALLMMAYESSADTLMRFHNMEPYFYMMGQQQYTAPPKMPTYVPAIGSINLQDAVNEGSGNNCPCNKNKNADD